MSIEQYRNDIDKIDKEIVELFNKRMETVKKVADYKKETGKALYDGERERQLIAKAAERSNEDTEIYTRVLFSTLTNLSRAYQSSMLNSSKALAETINTALENTDHLFPERAVVACQGTEGAYSQQACEKIFKLPQIMYMGSFEAVFKAVDMGLCKYGILPLENSTAGSVNMVYDLMSQYKFYIVRSVRCRINHALMSMGSDFSQIKEIWSHEQSIAQCSQFLNEHKDIKVVAYENNAVAAKAAAESGRKDVAVIASADCAGLYGMKVLRRNIKDNAANDTRFICISKNLEVYPGADRTSIKLTLPHRPGSLYHILARFYASGVNLVKLESRPLPGSDFEFMFYFDVSESVYSPSLASLLCELESEVEDFEYLGSYTELV
ncbi:MAG: prephenate dehydratase domain-containing protein [Eubacteriales bacterium]|nr:prephenate dehydratase domain-containing protein [Eubacteriales bacterium]